MKRICAKCHIEKDTDNGDFDRRKTSNGTPYWRAECKVCRKIFQDQYRAEHKKEIRKWGVEYRAKNDSTIKSKKKAYYDANKDWLVEECRKRHAKNKDYYSIAQKAWNAVNKDHILAQKNEYSKNKRHTDRVYKIRCRISNMVYSALKRNGSSKRGNSFLEQIPYSMNDLKVHIENQFEDWMTWKNWGKYDPKTWKDTDKTTWTWQIDHIIPQSVLPYIHMTDDNFKKCWSLENLRPLPAKQNIKDGARKNRHKGGK
jgi:hypothetical protein